MAVNKVIFGGETVVDLTTDTVTAAKMLSGTTAHDKSGTKVTGTIPSQAAQTITPGTADKTIASGKYLTGTQTIKGDANLVPENIASGVTIFGVEGTLEAGGGGGAEVATFTVKNSTGVTCIIGATVINDSEEAQVSLIPMVISGTSLYMVNVVLTDFTGGEVADFSSNRIYFKAGEYTSPGSAIYFHEIIGSITTISEFDVPEYNMFSHILPGATVELFLK